MDTRNINGGGKNEMRSIFLKDIQEVATANLKNGDLWSHFF